MKSTIKKAKASLLAVIAATAFVGFNAQANTAAPIAYANQSSSESLSVQVYQNGQPAEGATIKLYENNGSLAKELTTNRFGRINVSQLSNTGPLTIVAATDQGMSKPRFISLMSHSDR